MKNKIKKIFNKACKKQKRGFALFVVIIIMVVLGIMTTLLITIVLSEYKVSKSQEAGTGAFYVAEAGVEEVVWKVQNNSTYKDNLEDGTFTDANGDFSRNDIFGAGTSYEVSVRSTDRGAATITSTGTYQLANQNSQRVIKTKIFKALNPNPIGNNSLFTSDDIDILMSIVNFYDGGIFSNEDIDVPGPASRVNVEGNASAVGSIHLNGDSLVAESYNATNYPPAADPIDFPMVDFDELKANADAIYTKDEFEDLMWANPDLTLNNDITYITMSPTDFLNIQGGQSITTNGVIVIDGGLKYGVHLCWNGGPGPRRCGLSNLTVNHTVGKASGFLVKGDLDFDMFVGDINIEGLLYAYDELTITSVTNSFNVHGGFIARRFFCVSVWQAVNVYFDEEIVGIGLGNPEFSPIVQVEHWEEEY